jgi:AcrR family transcriptional regulator
LTATNHRINEALASHVAPVSESVTQHQPPHTPAQLSRTQILEATFFCLREEGYEATTIRRIAKRLDCAIGSIYRYFKDKRDLLSAVTQELLQPVVVGLENGSPIDRSIGMYCRLATGDAEAYRLMFWLACKSQFDTDLPEVVKAVISHWGKQLGDESKAASLWAMLHGLIILNRPEDQILNQTLDQLGQLPATPAEPVIVDEQPVVSASPAAVSEELAPQTPEVVIMPNLQMPNPVSQDKASEDMTLL